MKINERLLRGLGKQKGTRVLLTTGVPKRREGRDGDFSLRRTQNGVKLYAKYLGIWYSFSPDAVIPSDINVVSTDEDSAAKANGSIKLAGGFMIQWGHIATGSTEGEELFNIAFPKICVAVIITTVENNTTNRYEAKVKSKTTTGFSWFVPHADQDLDWIAIGN